MGGGAIWDDHNFFLFIYPSLSAENLFRSAVIIVFEALFAFNEIKNSVS